jgi:hypothetical protein
MCPAIVWQIPVAQDVSCATGIEYVTSIYCLKYICSGYTAPK